MSVITSVIPEMAKAVCIVLFFVLFLWTGTLIIVRSLRTLLFHQPTTCKTPQQAITPSKKRPVRVKTSTGTPHALSKQPTESRYPPIQLPKHLLTIPIGQRAVLGILGNRRAQAMATASMNRNNVFRGAGVSGPYFLWLARQREIHVSHLKLQFRTTERQRGDFLRTAVGLTMTSLKELTDTELDAPPAPPTRKNKVYRAAVRDINTFMSQCLRAKDAGDQAALETLCKSRSVAPRALLLPSSKEVSNNQVEMMEPRLNLLEKSTDGSQIVPRRNKAFQIAVLDIHERMAHLLAAKEHQKSVQAVEVNLPGCEIDTTEQHCNEVSKDEVFLRKQPLVAKGTSFVWNLAKEKSVTHKKPLIVNGTTFPWKVAEWDPTAPIFECRGAKEIARCSW